MSKARRTTQEMLARPRTGPNLLHWQRGEVVIAARKRLHALGYDGVHPFTARVDAPLRKAIDAFLARNLHPPVGDLTDEVVWMLAVAVAPYHINELDTLIRLRATPIGGLVSTLLRIGLDPKAGGVRTLGKARALARQALAIPPDEMAKAVARGAALARARLAKKAGARKKRRR